MNRHNQSPQSNNQAPKSVKPLLVPILFLLDANPAVLALQSVDTLTDTAPLLLVGVLILLGLTGLLFLQRKFIRKNQ